MKAAIIYCSNHGTTEKVAGFISEKLKGDSVTMINLLKDPDPSIQEYDKIIIGGSIHFGTIQKQIKRLCSRNEELLLRKDLGLFICCMLDEQQKEEFENAFPGNLRNHSRACGIFGGELFFEKMNFLEKIIVRKVAKADSDVSHIDYEAIDRFISQLNGENIHIAD